ncbi:uncharacterized protein LOC136043055 isoform X1 [Artemia franciscana]|uniref:uncharacterized protein LOC136043055 isoform X1 n=1 Tax=Artemia franciscana TaxID=6661 RepID=UPI0032DBB145
MDTRLGEIDLDEMYEPEEVSEKSEWSDCDDNYDDELISDDWLDAAEEAIKQFKGRNSSFMGGISQQDTESSDLIHRLHSPAEETTPLHNHKDESFWLGFNACIHETLRYLVEVEHLSPFDPLVTGLTKHLLGQSSSKS